MSQVVIVTGGAGFIGSHLCEALRREYSVVALDDLSSPVRWWARHPNRTDRRYVIKYIHDVRRPWVLPAKPERIVGVFHLACPTSVEAFTADPWKTYSTCVMGAIHADDLARRAKCPWIGMSSCEAYGDAPAPQAEDAPVVPLNPGSPRWGYEEGKRGIERLVHHAVDSGRRALAIRLFATYGPRMGTDGRLVSTFITRALAGQPLTVYGSGDQRQAPSYVADVVTAVIQLFGVLRSKARLPTAPVVNLGHPQSYSVRDLAVQIPQLLTGRSCEIEYKPARVGEVPGGRVPDLFRLRRWLRRWEPRHISEGLLETAAFYQRYVWDDETGWTKKGDVPRGT
jgi:UDP-glucuronate decarboxylase